VAALGLTYWLPAELTGPMELISILAAFCTSEGSEVAPASGEGKVVTTGLAQHRSEVQTQQREPAGLGLLDGLLGGGFHHARHFAGGG